jgi:cation transport ATPase
MALFNVRSMIDSGRRDGWFRRKPPLAQQLLPADQQIVESTAITLVDQLEDIQEATGDFCRKQGTALSDRIQRGYRHLRERGARRRATRAQVWLQPAAAQRIGSHGLTEAEVNRTLIVSGVIFGLDVASAILFPLLRIVMAPLVLVTMYPLFKFTWHMMRRTRRPNAALLVCITALSSVATGNYGLGVLTVLVNQSALKLQFRIQDDSKHRLVDVFKQQPHTVYALVNGVEVQTPFSRVRRGDTIVVHTGEMIPIDGIVTSGAASVDQHMLTGESQPVEKEAGDEVLAATMVMAGSLHIQAEKAGEETMVAQIGQILRKTISDKTDMQLRADAMADRTVTPTLILSLLTLPILGPLAAGGIIASHFGMRMTIVGPLAVLNYFRLLSFNQILIKDGRTLDMLRDVDTVVFDKTGTLTMHQPHVERVFAWANTGETEVLALAAAAEYKQTHPIARAIIEAAQQRRITIPDIDSAAYTVGLGLDDAHVRRRLPGRTGICAAGHGFAGHYRRPRTRYSAGPGHRADPGLYRGADQSAD